MHIVTNGTRRVAYYLILAAALLVTPSQASSTDPRSTAWGGETVPAREVAAERAAASAASPFHNAMWNEAELGGIDPKVFTTALAAAGAATARGVARPRTLTVIDFSRPSTSERLWVFDLRSRELLFEEAVAHGRNSGLNLTTSFSNAAESNKSSLGLFRTGETYIGKHGYSLRLDGLEPGVNDRARERAIVIHGAEYVNLATARAQGRLGRSLGCPAVRPAISRALIDAVKDGGLLFAYYPDDEWLAKSTFLN